MKGVNIDHLKGRVAEALVESIFRRAEYQVARLGRESQVQRLVQVGRVLARLPCGSRPTRLIHPLHRLLTIEVKYRSNLREFLRSEAHELVSQARDRWPELYFVLVTGRPDDGRSCFQVLAVGDCAVSVEPETSDLHQLQELDIFSSNIRQHEGLVREMFGLLGAYGRGEWPDLRQLEPSQISVAVAHRTGLMEARLPKDQPTLPLLGSLPGASAGISASSLPPRPTSTATCLNREPRRC